MQEDQITVGNNEVVETILPHDIDEENNAQISSMKDFTKLPAISEQISDSIRKDVHWCKDQTNDENSLCKYIIFV